MTFDFMTQEVWDGIVIGVVLIGAAFAILRLYSDFTRPTKPTDKQKDTSRHG